MEAKEQKQFTPDAVDRVPRNEQETVIDFFYAEKTAVVWTEDVTWIKKIKQLANEFSNDVKIEREYPFAVRAIVPKKWIRIARPAKRQPMSENQRQILADRLRRVREKKKGQ